MSQEAFVRKSSENGITTVTFFHPQSNSLPGHILNLLAETINQASEDPETRVIILRSEGEKAFCAGASFDELISISDLDQGKEFFSGFARVINAIRKSPRFVLARVQGRAVGGGVGLAAAADYTFALGTSSVKLSELAIGIGPFVVGPAVERKTGNSAFATMTINATEWHSADWAREKGLYAQIFPDISSLDSALMELARKLAASNPEAMAELKKVLWSGTDHWDTLLTERAAISGRLVLSEFTRNAINKFKKG